MNNSRLVLVPTGTKPERIHEGAEPYAIVTVVPNPGRRYEQGRRIVATLQRMTPGSDESFLVDSHGTAHHVARGAGFEIRTKRVGRKYRVWRIA